MLFKAPSFTGGGVFPLNKCTIDSGCSPDVYERLLGRLNYMEKSSPEITKVENQALEEPEIIEEIVVEELSIDGVCGVY